MMKKLTLPAGLVMIGLSCGCLEYPKGAPEAASGTLFRYHFVGAGELARNTNAAKLKTIAELPSTKALLDQTLGKLSGTPYAVWKKELPAGTSDQAKLLRPLLDDLLSAETYFEVAGPTTRPETLLAVQLNEERARVWQSNLSQLMLAWQLGNPLEIAPQGFRGWETKRSAGTTHFRFVRAGKWIIVSVGPDKSAKWPELIQRIKTAGRPVNALQANWIEVEADCPRLRKWLPVFEKYPLPPTHLTISGKGGNMRTEAVLRYSNPIPYKPEPWKIPTNTIRDPLVSFTVGRGIAPLLSRVKGVPELGLKELPNQFCLWGQSPHHVKSYASFPVADPTNYLKALAPHMSTFVARHFTNHIGNIAWKSNNWEIQWQDVPFVLPHLRPMRESGLGFVMGGLLHAPRTTKVPPPELYAQLMNRDDVLYYDWELTAERLPQSNELDQLFSLLKRQRLPLRNAPSLKWLNDIAPHLLNTITEISMKSPRELVLIRRSDLGLTGFELVQLARWIDSPGFPLTFVPPLATPPGPTTPKKPPTGPSSVTTTNSLPRKR